MNVTAKRLRNLREAKKMSQNDVAKILGISRTAYVKYETGESRPVRKLNELSTLFNVSTDYILGNEDKSINTSNRGVRTPVLGRVVAGIPMDTIEEIIDYEEIPKEMAATGEFFALKVKGHSMEPRILDGDVVIVKKQEDVESGDVAIVLVNGNEATVKRVKKQKNGITLIANNISVYEPHYYSNEEIEDLPVRILGKVVELRGKFWSYKQLSKGRWTMKMKTIGGIVLAVIVLGAIGNAISPTPSTTKSKQPQQQEEQAKPQPKKIKTYDDVIQKLQDVTHITSDQAKAVTDVMQSVRITPYEISNISSYENGKHDLENEKVYLIETSEGRVFLYLDGNGNIISLRANAKNLYKNNRVIQTFEQSFKK